MQGNPEILAVLTDLQIDERSAIQQYLGHESLLRDLGYTAFADIIAKRIALEEEHSRELRARIRLLGGLPDMTVVRDVSVGESAPSLLDNDLSAEMRAIGKYNAAITLSASVGDFATRALLEHIAVEENEHAREIEALIGQVNGMTLQNFLSTMTGR